MMFTGESIFQTLLVIAILAIVLVAVVSAFLDRRKDRYRLKKQPITPGRYKFTDGLTTHFDEKRFLRSI